MGFELLIIRVHLQQTLFPPGHMCSEGVRQRHRVSLYTDVSENRSKRNEWVGELLLELYSCGRALCRMIPTGVSWLWTFTVNVEFCDVLHVKLQNVKRLKLKFAFSEVLS
jgi:hypothetical protein